MLVKLGTTRKHQNKRAAATDGDNVMVRTTTKVSQPIEPSSDGMVNDNDNDNDNDNANVIDATNTTHTKHVFSPRKAEAIGESLSSSSFSSPSSNNVHVQTTHQHLNLVRTPKSMETTTTTSSSFTSMSMTTPMTVSSSRAHLSSVRVLQRKAILVSGLPKQEFQTSKAIEKEFRKYGVITNCIPNPKSICVYSVSKGSRASVTRTNATRASARGKEMAGTVYIRFLNEKSAANAILATNGQPWGSNSNSGNGIRLHSCFVNNRYCDEFLQGRYCQDLNCILLHETVKKDDKRKMSGTTVVKSPKHQNCWKTPRNFLVANPQDNTSTHVVSQGRSSIIRGSNSNHNKVESLPFSFTDNTKRGEKIEKIETLKSNPTNTNDALLSSNHNPYRHQSVVTPDGNYSEGYSTVTPRVSSRSESRQVDILSAAHGNDRRSREDNYYSYPVDLPKRQLFKSIVSKTKNCVIAPPKSKSDEEKNNNINGIDNPWAIQSPVMIGKDNFDTSRKKKEVGLEVEHSTKTQMRQKLPVVSSQSTNSSFNYFNSQSFSGYSPQYCVNQGHDANVPFPVGFGPYFLPSTSSGNDMYQNYHHHVISYPSAHNRHGKRPYYFRPNNVQANPYYLYQFMYPSYKQR